MNHRSFKLAQVLALIGLLCAGSAWAVLRPGNLGLTQGGSTCDGPKFTYTYTATWKSNGGASFQVNTGNQCALGGTVCGISTKGCNVTCSAQGACSAQLCVCVIGKGSPWVKVVARDGTVYQQITAAPPGKCE